MPRATAKSATNIGDAVGPFQTDLENLRDDIAQLMNQIDSLSNEAGIGIAEEVRET